MSWSLLAMPLHRVAVEGGWEWAAGAARRFGLPDEPPAPRPLPTASSVIQEFRAAGCCGTTWYRVDGLAPGDQLPGWVDGCADDDHYLGEVRLHPADGTPDQLTPSTPITLVSFRKPRSLAVLTAVHRLVAGAGPILICDDQADTVFVVSPGDALKTLVSRWPW